MMMIRSLTVEALEQGKAGIDVYPSGTFSPEGLPQLILEIGGEQIRTVQGETYFTLYTDALVRAIEVINATM